MGLHACWIPCGRFFYCKSLSGRKSYQTIGSIVDCLVLVITLRAPPSMDTIGEQLGCHSSTDAQCQKFYKDKTRVSEGKYSTEEATCFEESYKVGV
jgi:hypothetical protein